VGKKKIIIAGSKPRRRSLKYEARRVGVSTVETKKKTKKRKQKKKRKKNQKKKKRKKNLGVFYCFSGR